MFETIEKSNLSADHSNHFPHFAAYDRIWFVFCFFFCLSSNFSPDYCSSLPETFMTVKDIFTTHKQTNIFHNSYNSNTPLESYSRLADFPEIDVT